MDIAPAPTNVSSNTFTDEPEPVVSTQHSWGGETTLVQTVVEALSSARSETPDELEPLHYFVDVDALESIFEPRPNGKLRTVTGEVSFTVGDFEVVVESGGRVVVLPAS